MKGATVMKELWKLCGIALALWIVAAGAAALAQEGSNATTTELTLYEIIRAGGPVIVILGMLSVLAVALIVTYLIIISPRKETPRDLVRRLTVLLEGDDVASCIELCEERDEMVADVVQAGLRVAGQDRAVVIEAMQSEGARQAAGLRQRIAYLNNIAVVAPMLGILGTVLGMIKAFRGIAFEAANVRPMVLANGIAQALVTTAAGLIVAIPVMAFYFYFRGRVQKVVSAVEGVSSELVEPIAAVKVDK